MVGGYSVWLVILLAIALLYALLIHDAPVFQLRERGIAPDPAPLARWRVSCSSHSRSCSR
jgi:hypothetical protein